MQQTAQNRIKKLRQEKSLTQEDIAKLLGMSRSTYANWEVNITPDHSQLQRLANFHGVSIDYILNGEPIKVNEKGMPYMVLSPDDMERLAKIKGLPEERLKELDSFLGYLVGRGEESATSGK